MADENQNYSSYNGMLFDAEQANLLLVPEGMEGNAVLPVSVASVPAYAFSRCTKLSAITLTGSTGASAFTTQDGILYSADGSQLLAAPAGIGSTVTIAPACTHIAEGAFWGNVELRTIVVNGTVESIAVPRELSEGETAKTPEAAFNDATIKSATVVLNVAEGEREGAQAAWQAAGFTSFAEGAEPGASIEPVEGSGFAFDLKDDYTLAVRWQGEEPAPEKLEVPSYGIIEGISYKVGSIADEGFAGQEAIQQVELPEGISAIGDAAFKGATSLNTISIPGSVTSIGDEAFSGCDELVALDMAEGISSIGDHAFEGIAQKAIIVPASVKAVGDYAFANSPNLEMVVALGEVEQAGQSALGGTSGVSLYVPYRADGAYAWAAGLPATGNHLMPYGVKAPESTIEVNVGEQAELFAEGYLEVPEGFEVSYAYKAKPISIADDGTIEGKEGGASNVEVTLTLEVPRQVVSGIVSRQARLTQAAYDPTSTPFVQAADVVEATQPVTVSATASVLSVERATTGKTITFRVTDSSDTFTFSSYRDSYDSVKSVTFTGVTSFSVDSSGYCTINRSAVPIGYDVSGWYSYNYNIIPNNEEGWTLDPSRAWETGSSFLPSSISEIPDKTTIWLSDKARGKSGILRLKAQNTSLACTPSSGSSSIQIANGNYRNFYDVSNYHIYTDGTLHFNGKTSPSAQTVSYTVTGTPLSGYEFRGFKRGLDDSTSSLNSKLEKQGDGGSSFRSLYGDTWLVGFATEYLGKTITINPNGETIRRTYSSGSTGTYTSSITISGVREIRTIYDNTNNAMSLRLYTSSTAYQTISAVSTGFLGWSPDLYETPVSGPNWAVFYHVLDGIYYPNQDETIRAIWDSKITPEQIVPPSGWTVSTGSLVSEGYEFKRIYQSSMLTALYDGSVEVFGSYLHTLGTPQSVVIEPPSTTDYVGLSIFSTMQNKENVFIAGETYIPHMDGSYTTTMSVYPVYKNGTFVYDSNLPAGATLSFGWPSFSAQYGLNTSSYERLPRVEGGYAFDGFYTYASGSGTCINNAVGDSQFVWYGPGNTSTVYAKWVPVSVTATFNGNGSTSGSMASQTLSASSPNLKANAFTRMGYTFQGWATSQSAANAGTVSYSNSASILSYIQAQHTASVSLALYAVWSPNRTVVSFNGNNNTGGAEMAQQTILYSDADKTLKKNTYTREYYTFKGWGVSSYDITPKFADQESITISTFSYETPLNLFAVWSANYVNVTMHPNGAEGEDRVFDNCRYDDGSTWLPHNNYVRPGYSFLGWATSPTGAVVYEDGGDVIDAISPTVEESTLDLYAVWKAGHIEVPINYYLQNADDDDYTFSESMSRTQELLVGQSYSPSVFGTVSNYTLSNSMGDYLPKTVAGDGSTEFNIYWDRERYNLTYQYSGDIPEGAPELPATVKVRHGATVTLPEVSSIGTCVFKGWSINDSTELVTDATFIMPVRKSGTTVTGVWEYSDKYTVVYDKGFEGDDQTGPVDSTVYHVGDAVTLAQNNPPTAGFTRDGYVFLGWSTTAGHTNTGFRPGQQVALDNWIQNGVVALYAVWGPQVNVSSPITPSIKLMVRPSSAGSTSGALSESVAVNANLFTSQTPEDVLVSSMSCEPISGENGTAKVFKHENLWQFINVLLDGGGSAQASLPLSAATSLRQFTMDSDDKFIIPSGGELPVEVDLDVPEYVQVAIVDDEVDIARLAFTFQLAQPTE